MQEDNKINFKTIKTLGPSILKVEIPKVVVDKLNSYVDELIVNKKKSITLNHGNHLVGDVTQEFKVEEEIMIKKSIEISKKKQINSDNEDLDGDIKEISIDEGAILKRMFLIHYYDREIRSNVTNAGTDTIVQVTDQGSTVRKINKNEVVKSLTTLIITLA